MTPPPHIPPMPPVPREELAAAQGHPYPKAEAPAAPEPAAEEPSQAVITVRYNRRLAAWMTWLGCLLTPVGYAFNVYLPSHGVESQLFVLILLATPTYAAVTGIVLLTQGPLLTYNTRTGGIGSGILGVAGRLDRWKPGDRIDYSIHLAQLRIVRRKGRPKSLVHWGFTVNRTDWTAFVDVFLAHQNARAEALQEGDTAALPPVETRSPIKVGVRWRFFLGVLLGGIAFAVVDFALLGYARDGYDRFGPVSLAALGYVLFGAVPLLLNPKLIYESGQVSVKTHGRPLRALPRRQGARLEYSLYDGALYEVRGNGRRRRIAKGWVRDRAAWKSFVDQFTQDHPESIHPPALALSGREPQEAADDA